MPRRASTDEEGRAKRAKRRDGLKRQSELMAGVLPTLDPVALAAAIVGAVRGLVLRWTRDREGGFDLVRAVDTVIEVFFRGLLT